MGADQISSMNQEQLKKANKALTGLKVCRFASLAQSYQPPPPPPPRAGGHAGGSEGPLSTEPPSPVPSASAGENFEGLGLHNKPRKLIFPKPK